MTNTQQTLSDLARVKALFQLRAITATMGIKTSQTANPTPNRSWDWQATSKDYDGGDPIGFGGTPDQAVEDLLDSLELEQCGTCGDYHELDEVPFTCQTGYGEEQKSSSNQTERNK